MVLLGSLLKSDWRCRRDGKVYLRWHSAGSCDLPYGLSNCSLSHCTTIDKMHTKIGIVIVAIHKLSIGYYLHTYIACPSWLGPLHALNNFWKNNIVPFMYIAHQHLFKELELVYLPHNLNFSRYQATNISLWATCWRQKHKFQMAIANMVHFQANHLLSSKSTLTTFKIIFHVYYVLSNLLKLIFKNCSDTNYITEVNHQCFLHLWKN